MKTILCFFILLSLNISGQSQSLVKAKFFENDNGILYAEFIIPSDKDFFLYEFYNKFYGYYVLMQRDTLKLDKESMAYGASIINSWRNNFLKLNKCDTVINKVRNGALLYLTHGYLKKKYSGYIGYDNDKRSLLITEKRPSDSEVKLLCYDDFKVIITQWVDYQNKFIWHIVDLKKERLNKIENDKQLSISDINDFLNNFDKCNIDIDALFIIILNNIDKFSSICNSMSNIEFDNFKIKLKKLPKFIDTKLVERVIKSSDINKERKRKLVRTLRKKV